MLTTILIILGILVAIGLIVTVAVLVSISSIEDQIEHLDLYFLSPLERWWYRKFMFDTYNKYVIYIILSWIRFSFSTITSNHMTYVEIRDIIRELKNKHLNSTSFYDMYMIEQYNIVLYKLGTIKRSKEFKSFEDKIPTAYVRTTIFNKLKTELCE